MRRHRLLRLLFVLYCIEAGVFLTLVPWTSGWESTLLHFPGIGLRALGMSPFLRGLMSAFGVVHIVWAAHDLTLLISRPPEP